MRTGPKNKTAAVIIFTVKQDILKRGLDLSGKENRKKLESVTKYYTENKRKGNSLLPAGLDNYH